MREIARETETKLEKNPRGGLRRGHIRYLDEAGFYLDHDDHIRLAESFI